MVVHMNAFADRDACVLGQFYIRADANGHDQQIARQFGSVVQHQGCDVTVFAFDVFGIGLAKNGYTLFNQGLAQKIPCGLVQLAFH